MPQALFSILIFPGFLFVFIFGMAGEYIDRKLYARLQNRIGPPWFQPLADLIKLLGKQDIIPRAADSAIFRYAPVVALTAATTAFLYIPLWGTDAIYSFNGDLIVVLFLLTIPTLSYFLGGWYSRSVYSMIGAARALMQLFAYEVPLFMCVLAASLLANTWSLGEMTVFYSSHPGLWLFNIGAFIISLIALLGKLEKGPFDIPEAETEIVAGTFTEYCGRMLALFRTSINIEMIVGASFLAAVFLPFGFTIGPVFGFLIYIGKVVLIIALISFARTVLARFRMDQMINLCWKWLAPLAFLQVLVNLMLKGSLKI